MAMSEQFASIGQLLSRLDASGEGARPVATRPPGSGVAPKLPVQSPAQKKKPDEVSALSTASSVGATLVSPSMTRTEGDTSVAPTAEEDDDDLPAVGKVWAGPAPSLGAILKNHAAATAKPQAAAPSSNIQPVSPDDLPGVWKALLALLSEHGPGLHSLLSHGRLVSIDDGRAVIRYGARHETFVKMLDRNGKKELVRDAITRVLRQSIGVKFEVEQLELSPEAEAPAGRPEAVQSPVVPVAQSPVPQAPAVKLTPELVASIRESEPLVKALMDELGAQIIKVE